MNKYKESPINPLFWKRLFENDEDLLRLGNDREYMIREVNNVFILMFYGEDSPTNTFDTLNDAVKWVVNRMVSNHEHTSKDKPCEFHLHADWSKLQYQDENEGSK